MNDQLNHAELSLLGSILLTDGEILNELDFDPTSYSNPSYEALHQIMQGMHAKGEPVNVVTVIPYAARAGQRVNPLLLHEAMAATPTAASAGHYAKIVSDASAGRKIHNASQWMAQQTAAGLDPEQIIDGVQARLTDALNSVGNRKVSHIGEGLEEYIEQLEKEDQFIETPWPQINNIIGGLMPGALYVIGARPAVGKSVAAIQLSQALERHGSVALVSLEMGTKDLRNRVISNEKKIPMQRLAGGAMEERDWGHMSEWMKSSNERRIYASDESLSSIHDIRRFAMDVNRHDPLAGVVIDYLQLIAKPAGKEANEQEFIADLTRQFKLMALQLNIPVVLLSQLNRGVTSREDKMPRASDLRGSGAIEQDADVIILMHRELKGDESYRLYMNVEKNRRGPAGNTEMVFQGHYSTIYDDLSS
jgi:Replicative DNA helicase